VDTGDRIRVGANGRAVEELASGETRDITIGRRRPPYHDHAGNCVMCGAWDETRSTDGWCSACANAYMDERKRYMDRQKERTRQAGIEFWAARGIRPGDRVYTYAVDMLTGGLLGSMRIEGIARVNGRVGAYVSSPQFRGYLSPHGWRKVEG